jgi:hypothetical protein
VTRDPFLAQAIVLHSTVPLVAFGLQVSLAGHHRCIVLLILKVRHVCPAFKAQNPNHRERRNTTQLDKDSALER